MTVDNQTENAGDVSPHVFRTRDLPAGQRNRAWNEIAQPFFDHVVPLADREMDGEIITQLLGSWLACTIRFNPHSYARARAHAPDDGLDYYFIQLYRAGALQGECDGRGVCVRPGDILFLDVRESLMLRASAGEIITLIVPQADLGRPPGQLHGHVLERELPLTRVLAQCFEALEALLPELTAAEARELQARTRLGLMAALEQTVGRLPDEQSEPSTTGQVTGSTVMGEWSDDPSMRKVQETLQAWARAGSG